MTTKTTNTNMCPCGSGKKYSDCCSLIIAGTKKGETAESVMRARYTAYAKGEIDYIVNTLDPEVRDSYDREEIKAWSEKSNWMSLEIKRTDKGQKSDKEGIVEFIAVYEEESMIYKHHEVSMFIKKDGDWFFKDGELASRGPVVRSAKKVGRNDPCPCGSGKKYKKCCA